MFLCRADSASAETGSDPVRNHGISEFGELVIFEMNRLGMLVDLSHVSSETMQDVLDVSRAPVIFSHSSARSVCSYERNVPDDILRQMVTSQNFFMKFGSICFNLRQLMVEL